MTVPCNHTFTQSAFVLTYLTDEITKDTPKISIHDFEENAELQKEVANGTKIICCNNKHKLLKCWSTKINPYFRHHGVFCHLNEKHISFESQWHLRWKDYFDDKEVEIPKVEGSHKNRRADAKIGDMALEFQHSCYDYKEIDAKVHDYDLHNLTSIWIIDCNNEMIDVFDCKNGYYLITFETDGTDSSSWRYSSFRNQQAIYLDADDMIYMINPGSVVSDMVYTVHAMSKQMFVDYLKTNKKCPWDLTPTIIQCNLYISQQPAGSGKTYNSIQKLDGVDRFREKQYFIYITKLHSAKAVTKKEFNDQTREVDGKRQLVNVIDIKDDNANGAKQLIVEYTNKETQKDCVAIFQTIDSFMYQLRNRIIDTTGSNDYFENIVRSVCSDKTTCTRALKYYKTKKPTERFPKQINIPLDKRTLVIVDECQDLGVHYVNALMRIMGTTHIDVCVIGDKLQSIWGDINAFTRLDDLKNKRDTQIGIIEETPTTCVRRFHNSQLMNFVNQIVMFDKYGLPKIQSICCCDDTCRHQEWHDKKKQVVNVFSIPRIYGNISTEEKTDDIINKIITRLEQEIADNNYLPEHFTFIFPHLRSNELAVTLEAKLQNFWVNKFKNKEYNANVVQKNDYWKAHNNKKFYNRFVVLHKADEGQSINLDESDNATRIMSIHASKGTGREVVFVIGLNERSLHFYSNNTNSLQYESLLHVAITRQKKSLYIAVHPDANCDVYRRLSPFMKMENGEPIQPDLCGIGNTISLQRIIDYNFSSCYGTLDSKLKITESVNEKLLQQHVQLGNETVIDWGHHIIRNSVFKLRLLMNIYNNEKCGDNADQFKEIMRKLGNRKVEKLRYDKYYPTIDIMARSYRESSLMEKEGNKLILKIEQENDEEELKKLNDEFERLQNNFEDLEKFNKTFPLLVFEKFKESRYYEYCDIIEQIMNSVTAKIKFAIKKRIMPDVMCPIEMVVLHHMMLLPDCGRKSEVTIMDIYNIVYCYDDCFYKIENEEKDKHAQYKCLCSKLFNKNRFVELQSSATHNSIIRHYDMLRCVDKLYDQYRQLPLVAQMEMKYNINKMMTLKNESKYLPLCLHQQMIVASNANDVILIECVPQFTQLNANEIYTKMIYIGYICNKMETYANRHIHCILFTMNNESPIYFDMHDKIMENDKYLRKSCFDAIKDNILQYSSIAWMYYDFHQKNENRKSRNRIKYTLEQCSIKEKTHLGFEYVPISRKFPNWFVGFLVNVMDNSNNAKTMLADKDKFTNGLTEYIDKLIQKELNSDFEDDDDKSD